MSGQDRSVIVESNSGVTTLTLNRPYDANVFDQRLTDDFFESLQQADLDPTTQVVIVRGAGRYFCAGGDLGGMARASEPTAYLRPLVDGINDCLRLIAQARWVSIAMVDGPVAGAGLGIVLTTDLVLVTPEARFVAAYSDVALTPDAGVSYLLPRVIGPRRAAAMLLARRSVSAEEALEWGLATHLAPEQAEEALDQLVAEILRADPDTRAQTKGLLHAGAVGEYADQLEREAESISAALAKPAAQSRIRAFVDRSEQRRSGKEE